ncbi:MAG: DMT family transporter [Bacteroidia bacterium]|nr:DMT family transporter [Bacteroidia bacterium]
MTAAHSGLIAAFITVLSWACGTLAFTNASRLLSAGLLNKFRLMLALFSLTIIASVADAKNPAELITSPSLQNWLWLGLSGLVGLSIGDYFIFVALRIMGARRGSLFSTISPAASLLTGYFILGESINLIGIGGMLITTYGIFTILNHQSEKEEVKQDKQGSYTKGILMGIASAVCQGFGLVLAKKGMMQDGIQTISSIDAAWIRMLFGFGSLFLIDILRQRDVRFVLPLLKDKQALKYTLLGTLFGPVIGVSLSLYAASHVEVSLAQTILSLTPVMVLPLAALIYHTKITLHMWLGVLIAIMGVVVLIWRNEILHFF